MRRSYRVGEIAAASGVSVRTLHHYDAIGLLVPTGKSASGYRLYSDEDLLRLQRILIGRELGLSLEQVRRSLDEPGFDRRAVLLEQRRLLEQRSERTRKMIRAVDAALEAMKDTETEGKRMDMKALFDGFDPEEHAEEAERHWGETQANKVSMRRTKAYTEEDWRQLRDAQNAIYADAFAALQAGARPDAPEALDVAERHRLLIDRWFYPCSAAMHTGLADLWEADVRFRRNIDKHGSGLTAFLAAAVRANSERLGSP